MSKLKICFDRIVPKEDLPDQGKAHSAAVSTYNDEVRKKLQQKGKTLEQVDHEEFDEIAQSVGLRRHEPPHQN